MAKGIADTEDQLFISTLKAALNDPEKMAALGELIGQDVSKEVLRRSLAPRGYPPAVLAESRSIFDAKAGIKVQPDKVLMDDRTWRELHNLMEATLEAKQELSEWEEKLIRNETNLDSSKADAFLQLPTKL